MRRVIVESPLRGDKVLNEAYLAAALADCLKRGEAPFASHWMYPGILDDDVPDQRRLGMEAGFAWLDVAEASVAYIDLGVSPGMQEGIARARDRGISTEMRRLPGWEGRALYAEYVGGLAQDRAASGIRPTLTPGKSR